MRFIHVAYFAFVTLTTLGYGDIVPLTPLAKLSTIVFSLLGPFYLAVNMGVLIGRYIQQEQQES
jgi:voltage-gated potassium channel Kch